MQALRRQLETDGNGYDRYYDAEHGAAVVYENRRERRAFGYVNGVAFSADWPDTGYLYAGDRGQALAYRIRPEVDPASGRVSGWFLYTYMYSGGNNRSEWVVQVA